MCGQLPEDNMHFHELLQTLLPGSGYFLCQGLPSDLASMMTYDTKSARRWGLPFGRVDHQECPLWVKAVSSSTSSRGQPQRCEKCMNLMYYARREAKRRSVSIEQEANRVLPSSHCPLKYLSQPVYRLETRTLPKRITKGNLGWHLLTHY